MCRYPIAILTVLILVASAEPALRAQDWQWPSQLNVAGFSITGVRGNVNANGSGEATGTLQIPGLGGQRVTLNRSSRGDITGSASVNARASGAEIQGSFTLNNSGLRGRGTIKASPKPITDASITISPRGQASGTGRVRLSRATVNANFSLSSSSFNVSGSTSVQDQQNTTLATYRFMGSVSLRGSSGRISGTANGQVQRTGKLADQVTTHSVSNAPVDVATGRCSVNIGGVGVTFVF